ncbi:hypothetical protein BDQ17DRAFT_1340719 [Cyathus striatus]|nr:hypothetical protein BDQ17DRAFT_1340719 [Cyathus striatus]
MSQQRSLSRAKSPSLPIREDRREYIIGILLLLIVVLLWTSSNFLTQGLYEDGYEKPFLVTYLSTSAFTFYLFLFMLRTAWPMNTVESEQGKIIPSSSSGEYQPLVAESLEGEGYTEEPAYDSLWRGSASAIASENELPPLTARETAWLAFAFCFLWFMANWSVNASLSYTSVASATILTSMSGFFTLGLGRLFGVENFTVIKVLAVCVSFFGITLVSLSDNTATGTTQSVDVISRLLSVVQHQQRPIFGDLLALLSALFYALYVILLKVRIRNESRIDMQLFFGYVGLFNILCCWPIGVILHFTGVEPFSLPPNNKAWIAIFINMFITLSSDYLYVIAMLKTSPLVVTVGLSLTIPVAVIGDFFLKRPAKGQVIIGAILVLISFVVVGMDDVERQDNNQDSSRLTGGRGRSLENRSSGLINDVELTAS